MPPAGYPAFLQYLQSGRVNKVRLRFKEIFDTARDRITAVALVEGTSP